MSGNLVIVESPAKAKTIERYLGPGYTVLASYGHVRDLPENPGKNQLGVDVEHDFAPVYEVVADRRKQLSAIQKAASRADLIYLATDLDREGEAIAWHVAEAAGLAPDRTRRVTFSEITEAAIKKAFAEPRSIDINLVDAQQARRVVDRLVGYTLSPLLWRKVRAGLSAGRVQSVAVRLVVDREREIRAFLAREYWTLKATLLAPDGSPFEADLVRVGGKKPDISDGETAERHAAAIRASHPVVTEVSVKQTNRNPAPPFTTSSLQQEASRKLGFSPKRTRALRLASCWRLDVVNGGAVVAVRLLDRDVGHDRVAGADRRAMALGRLAVGDVGLLAADPDQVGLERRAIGRKKSRLQGPVLPCQEGADLALPIDDQPNGHGLDAAGRKPGSDLAPQQRAQGVADQAVDDPAGLLRVDEVDVDGARLGERLLDRRLGDLGEGDPAGPVRGEPGRLGDVPCDGLAFAVEVGGKVDEVGPRRRLLDRGQLLPTVRDDLIHGGEVVLHVHAELVCRGSPAGRARVRTTPGPCSPDPDSVRSSSPSRAI